MSKSPSAGRSCGPTAPLSPPLPPRPPRSAARFCAEHPGTTGSLGCAISEAVEVATSTPGYRYVLGSVLNQVLLHQSVIGLETKAALDKYGIVPDIIIGCAGGGSNLGGLIAPFMGEKLRGESGLPRSSPWSPPPAPASPAASSPTTSATPAWSARWPRCTPWAAASSPPPTTPAACGTTA